MATQRTPSSTNRIFKIVKRERKERTKKMYNIYNETYESIEEARWRMKQPTRRFLERNSEIHASIPMKSKNSTFWPVRAAAATEKKKQPDRITIINVCVWESEQCV